MKIYSVQAKESEDSIGNVITFYKEDGKIWISFLGSEERGFTINETKELIYKLQKVLNRVGGKFE